MHQLVAQGVEATEYDAEYGSGVVAAERLGGVMLARQQEVDALGSLRNHVFDGDATVIGDGVVVEYFAHVIERGGPGANLFFRDASAGSVTKGVQHDCFEIMLEHIIQKTLLVSLIDDQPLKLRIFLGGAFSFFYRVFGVVFFDFGLECFGQIDTEVIGHQQGVAENISQFVGEVLFAVLGYGADRGLVLLPLEDLQHFSRFQYQGQSKIFGIVELLPIPSVSKSQNLVGQLFDFGFGASFVVIAHTAEALSNWSNYRTKMTRMEG